MNALTATAPAEADVVIPVPDSSIPAAIGYARASGIPYNDGLIKNRYIGRTFIEPTQEIRDRVHAGALAQEEETRSGVILTPPGAGGDIHGAPEVGPDTPTPPSPDAR